jgi:putative membrane protein (TIGR04086 family)
MLKKFKSNLIILLIWFIVSLVIISITAVFVHFNVLDHNNKIVIFIIGLFLFLLLGFLSGNINQTKGLLNGIITAFIAMVILSLLFLLGYNDKITLDIIVKLAIFMLSSGLGGIFGVNFKSIIK